MKTTSWTKAVLVGLAAGMAATVVVDAIMMAVLRLSGQPAQNGFVLIGDTAAGFLPAGCHWASPSTSSPEWCWASSLPA